MRKIASLFAALALIALAGPALAQNTIPYEAGTSGLTSGNLVKSGATVGQLQDAGVAAANIAQINAAQTWTATQTFGTIGGFLAKITAQSGTTYTLASTDCGTVIRFTSASAVTVTLPNSLGVGCQVAMEQAAAGQVTLSPAAGATLSSAHSFTKTFGQNAIVGVTVDTNSGGTAATYVMTGDGA